MNDELLHRLDERVASLTDRVERIDTKLDNITKKLDEKYATASDVTHLKWVVTFFMSVLSSMITYILYLFRSLK
jgi:uncharacterized membrane protein YjjP (DUF1212 family)